MTGPPRASRGWTLQAKFRGLVVGSVVVVGLGAWAAFQRGQALLAEGSEVRWLLAMLVGALAVLVWKSTMATVLELIRVSTDLGKAGLVARAEVGGEVAEQEREARIRNAELSVANQELRANQEELKATSRELLKLTDALAGQSVQLHQTNKKVERASHLKSAFLANMSHELRTPLNSIIGFTELLRDELSSTVTPRHGKYFEDVRGAGHHLLELINDILDLSKIEGGHFELELQAVSPRDAVGEAAGLVRVTADKKGIELELGPGSQRLVSADPQRLRQVLLNLLSNAVKFSPAGTRVSLGSEDVGEAVRFWVRDTGPGIDPSVLPNLFEPFIQGAASMVKRHQGTGLGLAISRRLVRLHGSDLVVKTALGEGSTFSFSLPLVSAGQSSPADEPAPGVVKAGAGAGAGASILVIDDHDPSRELIRIRLESCGYLVLEARGGDEGLAMARAERPGLVLMDLSMPGIDGFTALARFRADADLKGTPVIAVTALAMSADEAAGRAAGFDDYVTKPIDFPRLQKAIERLLSRGDGS